MSGRHGGRRRLIPAPALRTIDAWFAQPQRNKVPPAKVLAHRLGVAVSTMYNAALRRGGYSEYPK